MTQEQRKELCDGIEELLEKTYISKHYRASSGGPRHIKYCVFDRRCGRSEQITMPATHASATKNLRQYRAEQVLKLVERAIS